MARGQRIITGDRDLDRKLAQLALGAANRVARKAMRRGASTARKILKAAIPASRKSVRRSFGSSAKFNRAKKQFVAKAGAGVGRRNKVRSSKSKGVGISKQNVHWWMMGTKERRHKKTGKRTGKMPPLGQGLVKRAWVAGSGRVVQQIRADVIDGIVKEAQKP